MRIKKHNNNSYLLTEDNIWVRDFTSNQGNHQDLNNLIKPNEYELLISNEIKNNKKILLKIEDEQINFKKLVIVSDGYGFEKTHLVLENLPRDVVVMAVNGALKKWNLIGKRRINFYVVNNPFNECLNFTPSHGYYPRCIASSRTNKDFIEQYKGDVFLYSACTDGSYYGMNNNANFFVDDYRNPICASLCLANRFKVKQILLLCCDDSFSKEREGSVKVNDLWCYPQHITSQRTIDGCLHWMNKEVKIASHSSLNYKNAFYIGAEDIVDFFKEPDKSNVET